MNAKTKRRLRRIARKCVRTRRDYHPLRTPMILPIVLIVLWIVPMALGYSGVFDCGLSTDSTYANHDTAGGCSGTHAGLVAVTDRDKSDAPYGDKTGTTNPWIGTSYRTEPLFQADSDTLSRRTQKAGVCDSGRRPPGARLNAKCRRTRR